MEEPEDRLTRGVLDAHEDNSLPVGGRTLYRVPWVGALVGALMMAGAAWVSASSIEDLRRWSDEPVPVSGPLGAAHAGQWLVWTLDEGACVGAPVLTETKRYQPIPQGEGPVVWIASDAAVSCAEPVTGVLRPAVRKVGEQLRATAPGSEHLVLWTHAGPANAWGLVAGGGVFAMLGLFVMAWFSVIGQRVRDARRRAGGG